MVKPRPNSVLQQVRSLAAQPNAQEPDTELLGAFVARRDEAAFEFLLRRHGPMVLRVARRVLGGDADAEDIFQATFLLLARKAGAIRRRASVASWLHGVAHRLALSARSKRARRQIKERRSAGARPAESPAEPAWSELEGVLHDVLAQLPQKYRTPLVYCYLEGRTQEEVARSLGAPLGTVRSWLARGRELLRVRLVRRGITLSAGGVSAALLASACAPAATVPTPLMTATLEAAGRFAAGERITLLVSAQVSTLVKKGMTAMVVAKLKTAAACLLVLSFLIAGTGFAVHRGLAANSEGAIPEAADQRAERKAGPSEERPRTDASGDPLPPGAVARLGTVRFRHEGLHFWQFAAAPDGRTLAVAAGRSLVLWEMATGRPLRRFPLTAAVRCLAFAPDGKSVVVGGEDSIVQRIDLATGKESQSQCFVGHQAGRDPIHINKGIWGVAFTPDGRKLITWGSDKTVRTWEAHSGKELRQFGPRDFGSEDWFVQGLSPDGKLLAVAKSQAMQMLRLWDLEAGKEVRQGTYPDVVGSVAFSPDGKTLAVASGAVGQPGKIALWELENGKKLGTLAGHTDAVFALAFSPDGKTLASGGYDKTIRLWSLASRKELHEANPLRTPIYQLAFTPDGRTLISRGSENHVRLWDVASAKERIKFEGPSQAIHCLAYSPNAELVASATGNRIWLWSATTGKVARILENGGRSIAFSADGKVLVSVSGDGTLQFWDPKTGKEQRCIRTDLKRVEQGAISPDGETIAFWGSDISPTIFLWSARTGEKRRDIAVPPETPGVRQALNALRFSPDGKILYASSGTHLRILRWDVAAGKALSPLGKHNGGLNGIAPSPDGRSIAALSLGGTLYLWETATGQARLIIKDAGFATSVAFSLDGCWLALVNAGNHRLITGEKEIVQGVENQEQVRLVRVADGKVVRRFTGHLGGINCVRFSPDGRTLASGGQDTTVLLWDIRADSPTAKDMPSLKPEKLAELWKGLRGTAAESHGCMNALIAAPGQTVQFLGAKLKPIVAVDAERFAGLLKKLDSDQFREREEATKALKELGESAEPALRKALQENRVLETKRRLQLLLDELGGTDPVSGERLRVLRAVEVLERIGGKPARDLLRRLSEGAAGAWLTEEARTTLQRLENRRTPAGGMSLRQSSGGVYNRGRTITPGLCAIDGVTSTCLVHGSWLSPRCL